MLDRSNAHGRITCCICNLPIREKSFQRAFQRARGQPVRTSAPSSAATSWVGAGFTMLCSLATAHLHAGSTHAQLSRLQETAATFGKHFACSSANDFCCLARHVSTSPKHRSPCIAGGLRVEVARGALRYDQACSRTGRQCGTPSEHLACSNGAENSRRMQHLLNQR